MTQHDDASNHDLGPMFCEAMPREVAWMLLRGEHPGGVVCGSGDLEITAVALPGEPSTPHLQAPTVDTTIYAGTE
jgi:hypothetical protein